MKLAGISNRTAMICKGAMAVGVCFAPCGSLMAADVTHPPAATQAADSAEKRNPNAGAGRMDAPVKVNTASSAEPKQIGGETLGIVHVANLIYAGTKSSKCFADHFLIDAEQNSTISTNRRFHGIKLDSAELFEYPLVIMTGEGAFQLTDAERKNVRTYIERGGFLLASAGCSSIEWNRSFRAEMARIFPKQSLTSIELKHAIFHTVFDIAELKAKHGRPKPLEGITLNGRLGVLYSQDGLNDTAHTQGCCCCGGNEITNAAQINVNILAYALTF